MWSQSQTLCTEVTPLLSVPWVSRPLSMLETVLLYQISVPGPQDLGYLLTLSCSMGVMPDLALIRLLHAARSGDISVDDRIKLEASVGHAQHRGYKGAPLKTEVTCGPTSSERCMANYDPHTRHDGVWTVLRKRGLMHSDVTRPFCYECTASTKDWTLLSMCTV